MTCSQAAAAARARRRQGRCARHATATHAATPRAQAAALRIQAAILPTHSHVQVRTTLRVASEDTEDEGVVTRVSLELSLASLATQAYDGDYVRGAARASREAREAREAEREAREGGEAIEAKGARDGETREAREARKLDRRDRPRKAEDRERHSQTSLAASDAAAFLGGSEISESRTRRGAAVTQDDALGRKVPGQGVPATAGGMRLFLSPGQTGYTGVSHRPRWP